MRGFVRGMPGLAWALALLLVAMPALAQRVEGDRAAAEGIYEAEVPVRSQSEEERQAGFARALAQVFAKRSGERSVVDRPGVVQELRRAADHVEGFDYRQDEGVSASGTPTFRTTLVVRFKPESVDALADALGLPEWPQPRPKPVVWLAIDDGNGPRLVGLQHNTVARPLLQRAIERGFRLGLPSGSAAEQAAVGAIWRKDPAAVARASARYSPPMQLIGKMYRGGSGWTAEWTFVDAGRVLATRTVNESDPRRALSSGADVAADALIQRYAKVPVSEPAGTYRVAVTGLRGAEDYLQVSALLQRLPVVRRIAPVRATAERIEFDLDLLTGLSGLDRMLGQNAVIEPVEGEPGEYRIR